MLGHKKWKLHPHAVARSASRDAERGMIQKLKVASRHVRCLSCSASCGDIHVPDLFHISQAECGSVFTNKMVVFRIAVCCLSKHELLSLDCKGTRPDCAIWHTISDVQHICSQLHLVNCLDQEAMFRDMDVCTMMNESFKKSDDGMRLAQM